MKNFTFLLATILTFCCYNFVNAQATIVDGVGICADGSTFNANYLCDGSSAWGNAGWGADCADGSDEDLNYCCAEGYYAIGTCESNGWSAAGDGDGDGDGDGSGDGASCDGVDSTVSLTSDYYGDGWYGATYSISDADGNVVASGPSDMGSWGSLVDTFCLQPGCYSFAATSVGYDSPMFGYGWSFGGESGYTGGSAGPISIGGASCAAIAGCTNAIADNYNAEANSDDGSCTFTCPINNSGNNYMDDMCYMYVMNYGYTVDEMINIYGFDCSCVPVPVMGCMDASADNYNSDATDYDGSCVFTVAVGDEAITGSYDYVSNDASSWTFTGAEGNLLTMTLGGSTESGFDYLTVNGTSYNGSLEGIIVESTDNVITMSIDSDASFNSGPFSWSVVSALPATCDDDSACNFGEIGNCSFPEDGFDCNGNCLSGVAATLTANDQYSDSWNGAVMNVTIDGVLFDPFSLGFTYTLAGGLATEATTVCLPDGVIAGTSCVQIEVTEGDYPSEISWALDVYGSTIAAGGAPFFGELGCAISGCMDDTACNYNSEATVSDDASCTYPADNADCEGNFVCNDLLFTLDMYDLSGDADGWNGNTFQVVDWVTGEVVAGAGPFTFDDGEMGTALACFPEDMATGCYVMEIGGGENESQVGWHLYGFEVFGSYVVDWSAGMAQEWSGVGGELLFGDSQTYQDENGDFIDCTEDDGLCEGYGDWLSGVGTYDTNNDGAADGYDIGYGCPCLNQDAVNYVFTSSENPYGEVIPVDAQDQTDPCNYGDPVVAGCTDMYATNYNQEANEDDGSCVLPDCVGTGADQDATVAALVAGASQEILGSAIMVNGCYDGLQVLASLGVTCDTDMSIFTDQLPAGTTAQMLCGCSCPDPVAPACDTEPVVENCETCCVFEAGSWINSNVYQLGGDGAPTLAGSSAGLDSDTSNDWSYTDATWSSTTENGDGTVTAVYTGGILTSSCFNGEVVISTTYGVDAATGLPNTAIDYTLADAVDNSVIFTAVSMPNMPTDDELASAQLSGTVSAGASIFVDSSLDLGCGCGVPAATEGYDCAGDPLTCAGSGTNMNDVIAAGFGSYGITNCEGVIDFLMGSYGYSYEDACAWDGTGFAPGMFGELGTLGGACGCSCAEPVAPACDTEPVVENCETCCVFEAGSWINSNVYQLGGDGAPTLAGSSAGLDSDTSNDWSYTDATWSSTTENGDGTVTAVYTGGILTSSCFNGEVVISTTYGVDAATGLPNTAIDYTLADAVDNSVIFTAVSMPNMPTDDELASAQLSGTVSAGASIFVDSSLDLGCGCGVPAATEGYDCAGNPLTTCVDSTVSLTSDYYADGWYGATYSISDADGNVVASGPSDMGSWGSLVDTFCLEPGCYSFAATSVGYDDPMFGYGWSFGGESGYTGGLAGPISIGGAECDVVAGCTDSIADNYNAEANSDDGSCTYSCPLVNGVDITTVEYNCYDYVLNLGYSIDEMISYAFDCTCVEETLTANGVVFGCTDSTADNYNVDATNDDGSCTYPPFDGTVSCINGPNEGSYDYENNDESVFEFTGDEGSILMLTLGGTTEANWDFVVVDGVSYTGDLSGIILTSTSNVISITVNSDGSVQGGPFTWSVSCVDDSEVMGCMDSAALNYNADATMDDGSCSYPISTVVSLPFDVTTSNCGMGDDVTDASTGYSLVYPESYYLGGEDAVYEFVGSGNPVEITLTANDSYTGLLVFEGNPNEGGVLAASETASTPGAYATVQTTADANYFVVVDSYPSPYCYDFTLSMSELVSNEGCTDAAAFNYDAEANTDDGSCSFDAVVSCDESSTGSYAYGNNESSSWTFTGEEGSILTIAMSGSTESCCDDLIINGSFYAGDFTDLVVTSTDNVITLGVNSDGSMTYEFGWSVTAECTAPVVPGCTDAAASNYNADATEDDGSCEFCPIVGGVDITTEAFNCYDYVWNYGYTVDQMVNLYDFDCTCVTDPVIGCDDETAENYNVDADVIDNTSCVYPPAVVVCGEQVSGEYCYTNGDTSTFSYTGDEGSTLTLTLSGNTESGFDFISVLDGAGNVLVGPLSGTFEDVLVISSDNVITVSFDSDGSVSCDSGSSYLPTWTVACVDASDVVGCTDGGDAELGLVAACNYDETATIDDGSCFYPNECDSCEEDTSCLGCNSADACNYDETATVDDGSCEFAADGYDCEGNFICPFDLTTITYVAASGISYETENAWQILDADGNIVWTSTYSTFGVNDPTDVPISPVSHNGLSGDFCMDPDGCYSFNLYDTFGDGWNGNTLDAGAFGVYTVQAGTQSSTSNCVAECTDTEVPVFWVSSEDTDMTGYGFSINGADGPVASGSSEFDGIACLDLAASCYSLTLSNASGLGFGSEVSISVDGIVFTWLDGSNGSFTSNFEYAMGSGCPIEGCTDATACNYVGDDLVDGYFGFLDCEYPEFGYDCEGTCLEDSDADGTCDVFDLCPYDAEDSCAGCTDETATNYSETATVDDGSCYTSFDCADGLVSSYTYDNSDDVTFTYQADEGSFVQVFITGETESCCDDVNVYNGAGELLATLEGQFSEIIVSGDNGISIQFVADGSILGGETVWTLSCVTTDIPGCTDVTACNYNENATLDNGLCAFPDAGYDCDGVCLADTDGDGVCDDNDSCPDDAEDTCLGCTDGGDTELGTPAACNYDETATVDDGSCTYAVEGYDCEGVCLTDTDADGICDEFDSCPDDATDACLGCTDEFACNYSDVATIDNGSCEYPESGYNCDGELTCEFGFTTVSYDGSGNWQTENSWIVSDSNGVPLWEGNAIGWTEESVISADLCLDPDACYTFNLFDTFGDGWNGNSLNAGDFGSFTFSGGPSYEASNCIAECTATEVSVSWVLAGEGVGFSIFDEDGSVVATGDNSFDGFACLDLANCYSLDMVPPTGEGNSSTTGAGITIQIGDETFEYTQGSNGIWSSIFTNILGDCPVFGCTDATACNYSAEATDDDGSCEFTSCVGCADATACNYNPVATEDDGSCTYPAEDYLDCAGSCLSDVDADGICDQLEIPGCTDMMACNYDPNATDDNGSCAYTDGVYDCDGITCLADTDGDGVCDPNEVLGCTDSMAANFDSSATDDDGSCEYNAGCTDLAAANYDSNATTDDGSCEYGPWDVTATDCNMTVLVQADSNITVEGEAITGDIWVGAFNSDGLCAGSVLVTPGTVTSIALWGAESGDTNGFQDGGEITWAVYYNGEEIPATVGWSFGESTYSCNGLSGVDVIAATSIYTQEISLAQGWNIWSTYISPENYSMSSVFDAIVDDVIIIKDENGLVFWPAFGLNNIGNLSDGEGYQAKMEAANTLSLEGSLVPYDMEMNLDNGWNIMGYLHQDPMDAADALDSMVESIVIVKDENGLVFWPAFGLNNIGNMMAGEGYQIKTDGGATFSYPSMMGSRLGYANPLRTVHFDRPANTGSNMVIGLPSYVWNQAPSIGDEIAVYDEAGNLVGSSAFEGGHVAITVWGDDLSTDRKEGLVEGEELTFKLWHSETDVEETFVVTWEEGSGSYITDGVSVAGNISLEGNSGASSYELYQNVPNPFNGKTSIGFFAPVDGQVSISVYNMLGELVEEVTNDIYSAGEHTVRFESNELGQGTYFVKMTTADWSGTRSMNLVK